MRIAFFALFLAATVHGQSTIPPKLQTEINKLAAEYAGKRTNAGFVIGLSVGGQKHIKGFGRINGTNAAPPDAKTVFEIGSITKVFTAILLAQLVEEGKLSLSNTVNELLKTKTALPEAEKPITLQHLATHSSGLPRLAPNWRDPVVRNDTDPYAGFKAEHLYAGLRKAKFGSEPGEKYLYSNFGFGTLGHILELQTGMDYPELVKRRICKPLGLRDTTVGLSPDQKTRLAQGHSPKGRPVNNWHFQVMAGAGALRSTAEDMLEFIQANMNPNTMPLGKALQLAQKTHFKAGGVEAGLGWAIARKGSIKILWHNGGTGGYISFAGFDPQNKTAVVILSNYGDALAGDFSTDKIAMTIFKEMAESR